MGQFIEQGLLMLYSFIFLMRVPADMEFVAAFLVTLIYICVGSTIVSKRILTITTGLYLLAAVCFPDFLLFAPAVLYEMLKKGLGQSRYCSWHYLCILLCWKRCGNFCSFNMWLWICLCAFLPKQAV